VANEGCDKANRTKKYLGERLVRGAAQQRPQELKWAVYTLAQTVAD
jgi:hypothetical protein